MITEIRHTGIVVQDLNKVLNFFTKLLRFKIKKKMNEKGSYIDNILGLKNVNITTVKIEAPDGNLIELLKFKNFRSKKNWNGKIYSTGLTHISMTVKNLEKTYILLKKKKKLNLMLHHNYLLINMQKLLFVKGLRDYLLN